MTKPMTFQQVDHFNDQMDAARTRNDMKAMVELCGKWDVRDRLPKSVTLRDLVCFWRGEKDHSFTRNYFVI